MFPVGGATYRLYLPDLARTVMLSVSAPAPPTRKREQLQMIFRFFALLSLFTSIARSIIHVCK